MSQPSATPPRRSADFLVARTFVRAISSLPFGLALLVILFLYLAAGSLVPSPTSGAASWPFTIWPLKALLGLLVFNMTLATVLNIPFRLARLGAWMAHVGTLVLAGGAVWYMGHAVAGYAAPQRMVATSPFPAVDRFYTDYSAEIYARTFSDDKVKTYSAVLSPQPEMERSTYDRDNGMSVVAGSISGLPAGVKVEARQFIQAASVEYEWQDDGPADMPGISFQLSDGPHSVQQTLAGDYPFARVFTSRGYAIRYEPQGAAEEALTAARGAAMDIVLVSGQSEKPGTLLVVSPSGQKQEQPLELGKDYELTLGGRKVTLSFTRFLSHAWRKAIARPVKLGEAQPALEVDISLGEWRTTQWLVYDTVLPSLNPMDPDLARVPLGEGRWLYLQFGPRSHLLPHPIQITKATYESYPGSGIPKDYICDIDVLSDTGTVIDRVQCRLNKPVRVGEYRLYQGSWLGEDPNAAQTIVLLVRSETGMWAVWLGMILICLSIPWGFYVKPVLMRESRRKSA